MTTLRDYLNDLIIEYEKQSSEAQSLELGHDLTEEELAEVRADVVDEYVDIIKERIIG